MARHLERERPRRGIEWGERKRLWIEEEKLQNSRDFKEITFAITLFGGLLAFLIKLGDYFNNNVLKISGQSLYIIYITVWIALIVSILLFYFLIFKWYLVSTKNENKWLKNITQKSFGFIPLFIVVWFTSLFLIVFTNHYKDEMDTIVNILLLCLVFLIIVFVKTCFDNKTILIELLKSIPLKKVQEDITSQFKEDIFTHILNILIRIIILTIVLFLLVSTFLLPTYLLAGSYLIEKFQPSDTNNDIITFTIKETGIPISNNHIRLYELRADDDIFFQKDYVIINATHENQSDNKSILGKNHEGIWYLNLNTSNLTSGNYKLHAEVTNDWTINYIFGTIKKHDDILFYIPPKTEPHSYNSTKQE